MHIRDNFLCPTQHNPILRRRRLLQEMAEHQAVGAALAQDVALFGQDGKGKVEMEVEAAELEAELEALLRTEDDSTTAASPSVPTAAAAAPTGGAAAPAAPAGTTPSPSLAGAVPEKRAVPAPA